MKKYIILLLGGFLILNSCTLVTEPERFYNDKAYPPDLYYFNFENLQPGQHIDGTARIYFNPPNIDYDFNEVLILIDSTIYRSFNTLPYVIELNTRQFNEGQHTISLYVYQKDKPHGLLNLLNPPSDIFQTSLYFDRTPPSSVQLTVTNINDEAIKLDWTESMDETFFAYLLYKSINDSEFVLIDTITDKSSTTFTDTGNFTLIGANYSYKIDVTTDYLFTYKSESNIGKCKLGNSFEYAFSIFKGGPYLDDGRDIVYYLVDNQLVCFSTINNSFKDKVILTGLPATGEDLFFNFNSDKSKIYLLSTGYKSLWVINALNLSLEKQITLPVATRDFYVLDDSRIMLNNIDWLKIIDINSNSILNTLILPVDTWAQFGVVNEQGTRLILSWWPQFIGHFFAEMDITDNNFQILRQIPSDYTHMPLVITNNRLYNNGTKIYDLNTFNFISFYPIAFFNSFAAYDDKLACLHYISGNIRKIHLYDIQNQLIQGWFIVCGQTLQVGRNKIFTEFGSENILGYSLMYGE